MTYRDWMRVHGDAVRAIVARQMPDEPEREVEAITGAVIVRAAYGSDDRPPIDDPGVPTWLEQLARQVCEQVAALDVRPWAFDWDAVHRHSLERRRAEWERLEREYPTGDPVTDRYVEGRRKWLGLGVLAFLPRRVRVILGDAIRSAQDRVVSQGAALGELQAFLPAAPAVRQAAAAVGAVIGLVVPVGAASAARPPAIAAAVAEPAAHVRALEVAQTKEAPSDPSPRLGDAPPEQSTAAPPAAPVTESVQGATASENGAPMAAPSPPAPITAAPPEPVATPPRPGASLPPPRTDDPVDDNPHDGGNEYVAPADPAVIDLDGDGEQDVAVGPPEVGIDCPKPEERGVVTGAVCPVVGDAEGEA